MSSACFIVEANILEQKIMLSCNNLTTVADFSVALAEEYFSIFPLANPFDIKCIRDSKKRILSSKLYMRNVETELFIEVNSEPAEIKEPEKVETVYRKWQLHTVNQTYSYLAELSKSEKIPEPDTAAMRLIEELRLSSDQLVQLGVIRSLLLILKKFKTLKRIQEFAEKQTYSLLETSKSLEVTLKSIKLFKHFGEKVDISR